MATEEESIKELEHCLQHDHETIRRVWMEHAELKKQEEGSKEVMAFDRGFDSWQMEQIYKIIEENKKVTIVHPDENDWAKVEVTTQN